MRFVILTLLLTQVFCISAFSQRRNVYYLKFNGKYVDVLDSADYVRIISEPDSGSTLFNVAEFYKSGAKKLVGLTTTVEPVRYENQITMFYENGKRKGIINYKNGIKQGTAFEFYPNGKFYVEKRYPAFTAGTAYNEDAYEIINASDSAGVNTVTGGNGYFKSFDEDFKYVNDEGWVKNARRDSVWKVDYKNITTTATEVYKNGVLISGTSTDEAGNTHTYTTRYIKPQFKGGERAFARYLANTIRYTDEDRKNDVQGTVILSFVVEKTGKISDIVVLRSLSPGLDKVAIDVLKTSPLWIPGMSLGVNRRVKYSVPITFALSN